MEITLPENLVPKKREIQKLLNRISETLTVMERGKDGTPHQAFLKQLNLLLGEHLIIVSSKEGITLNLGVALEDSEFWRAQ